MTYHYYYLPLFSSLLTGFIAAQLSIFVKFLEKDTSIKFYPESQEAEKQI